MTPRQPVEATPRRPMTPARRGAVFASQSGKCAMCSEPMTLGEMEVDHRVPLELAGRDEPGNWQGLHGRCHARKTKLDAKVIARVRRLRKRVQQLDRICRHPIRSRGFDKGRSLTHPTLKRGVSGTVSKREVRP